MDKRFLKINNLIQIMSNNQLIYKIVNQIKTRPINKAISKANRKADGAKLKK